MTYVSSTLGGVNAGQTTNWPALTIPASGTLQVSVVTKVNTPIATAIVSNLAKPTGTEDPACPSAACAVNPTAADVKPSKQLTAESGTKPGVAEAGERLPAGAALTTANPLVRRITPGLPVRFDFGVRLPQEPIKGAQQIDIELGEVVFAPGSSEIRKAHLPSIEKMAARINEYDGGDVLIRANGENQALALARAQAVETALQGLLAPRIAKNLRVAVRTEPTDPRTLVVGVQQGRILLGTVLFDTDQSKIRPEFEALLRDVARRLAQRGGGVVALVGHADSRAPDAYNMDLGMRRAKAVLEAVTEKLPPEIRAKVRVELPSDEPAPGRSPRK